MFEDLNYYYPGDIVFKNSNVSVIILSRKKSLCKGNVKYSILIVKSTATIGIVLNDVTVEILRAFIAYSTI